MFYGGNKNEMIEDMKITSAVEHETLPWTWGGVKQENKILAMFELGK